MFSYKYIQFNAGESESREPQKYYLHVYVMFIFERDYIHPCQLKMSRGNQI